MTTLRHNDFELSLPEDWQDGSQVIALGPLDSGFRPNLVMTQEPLAQGVPSIEVFAQRLIPELERSLKRFSVLTQGPAQYGSRAGILREQTFESGALQLTQIQFYFIHGASVCTLTFTHLRSRMARFRALAENMFAQARIGSKPIQTAAFRDEAGGFG